MNMKYLYVRVKVLSSELESSHAEVMNKKPAEAQTYT